MGANVTPSGGTGGELRYTLPFNVEEYFDLHVLQIDARQFAIKPSEHVFLGVPELSSKRRSLLVGSTNKNIVEKDRIQLLRSMPLTWTCFLYLSMKNLI